MRNQYIIVTSGDYRLKHEMLNDLVHQVNYYISEGYVCQGGIGITPYKYRKRYAYQAMVLPDDAGIGQ